MSELPKGWVESNLNKLAEIRTGKVDANHATINGKYHFFTCAFAPLKSDTYSFNGELIILPGNGANVGLVQYFNGKIEAYQRTYVVYNSELNIRYVYYHLKKYWKTRNEEKQYGSATNYIKMGNFNEYVVAFPPLAEQKRIVEKLDEVLAQVDSIKARLDSIPDILKRFRQSVLASAVSGKLTEGCGFTKAKKSNLSNLGKILGGKTPSKSNPLFWSDGSVLWVSPKDMKFNYIVDSIDKITEHALDNGGMKYIPQNSILMVTRSGILSHTFPVALTTTKVTINQDIKALIPNNETLIPTYGLYLIKGLAPRILSECSKTGTTVPSIETDLLQSMEFNLPSLEEQTEIVRLVDQYFAFADAIEKQVKNAQQRVDKLTQSILAKAFRGELVQQDPNDEPADKLLERIAKAKQDADALAKAAKKSVKKGVKK
ncbi:MAG: restriction endonuclease subunit S [Marinomonas sp.]